MGITREAIEARMAELERQREDLQSKLLLISGAFQDCKLWLVELDKPE